MGTEGIMSVQTILKEQGQEVLTIEQQAPVQLAAQLMSNANTGALIVTAGDKVMGLLTNRDIVNSLSRYGWRVSDLTVADIMRTGIAGFGDVVKHRLRELELETNVLRDAWIAVR
jgi:CBS domain-containing protein